MTTYSVFTPDSKEPVFHFAANFQYSANPLLILGGFSGDDVDQDGEPRTQATPYRSADAGRDPLEAGRLLAEWLASETGEDHGADDPGLQVERITYEIQQWMPSSRQYEPIDNGECDTEAEAHQLAQELVDDLGWMGLRIVAYNRAWAGSTEVVEQFPDNDEEGPEA